MVEEISAGATGTMALPPRRSVRADDKTSNIETQYDRMISIYAEWANTDYKAVKTSNFTLRESHVDVPP